MSRPLNNDVIETTINVNVTEAQRRIHELSNSTRELKMQNSEMRREITRLQKQEGDHSGEIRRLTAAIEANSRRIRENNREVRQLESGISSTDKTAAQLRRELGQLTRAFSNVSKAQNPREWEDLRRRIDATRQALREAQGDSSGTGRSLLSLSKIAESLKGAFMGVGLVIGAQVMGQLSRLKDIVIGFESANSRLAGVLGTNIEGVAELTEQARYLGRTTTATASDVTSLQTELAKLGFSTQEILDMAPATLRFATSLGTDLGSAAAMAGATLKMFGKDASQTDDVLATLAVATTKSALDFSKLNTAMSTVGPTAAAFGFSIEETVALLGALSDAGFDASSAATATRNMLLSLADSSGDLAQALGAPVTDLDSLMAGMRRLQAGGIDLAKALDLTDKATVSAFQTFLRGADSIIALRDGISGVSEEFTAMSEVMADNAEGAWKGCESAVEGLML